MIVSDWYDGPVGGLVSTSLQKAYTFYLLDWNPERRIRLLALQEISVAIDDLLLPLTNQPPKWPVWFPSELIHPNDKSRNWLKSIEALRIHPHKVESILIWDNTEEKSIALKSVPQEYMNLAIPWFDAADSGEKMIDWFNVIVWPRN